MIFVALTMAAVSGCSSPKGGGMSSDEGFSLSNPFFTRDVKQGGSEAVTITVNRDKYFKQDVKLQAVASPGITIDPSNVMVKASDSPDVQFKISAPANAALGEYLVHVKATPATGQPTATDIKVKVVAP
jgi:hypothetical protein